MGRLKDLVSKVKEEVAPIASVVREEVAQQMEKVVDRVLSPPPRPAGASATAKGGPDEWAFTPAHAEGANGTAAASAANASSPAASNGAARSEAGAKEASSSAAGGAASAAPGTTHGTDAPAKASSSTGQGENAVNPAPATPSVRINAQPSPTDPATCKFTVEIPVFEERLVRIRSREVAEQCSPLAQKLFEIPQVAMVTFSGSIINVSKKGSEPWQMIARQIGPAIRAHIASGLPALTQEPPVEESGKVDDAELRDRVQHVIDTLINPGVAGHGGYVTLAGVENEVAYITMGGGCQGCGMADVTLRQGIVATIRAQVPEIAQVLDATDHAGGLNPYYQSAP